MGVGGRQPDRQRDAMPVDQQVVKLLPNAGVLPVPQPPPAGDRATQPSPPTSSSPKGILKAPAVLGLEVRVRPVTSESIAPAWRGLSTLSHGAPQR